MVFRAIKFVAVHQVTLSGQVHIVNGVKFDLIPQANVCVFLTGFVG